MHVCNITDQTTKLDESVNQSKQVGPRDVKKGAWSDWWKKKKENNLILHQAAESGDVQKVKDVLDKSKLQDLIADINSTGLDDWTALHFAANEGNIEVAKELVFNHADTNLNAQSTLMRTPMHLASIRGHTNIARLLVDAGANTNA